MTNDTMMNKTLPFSLYMVISTIDLFDFPLE